MPPHLLIKLIALYKGRTIKKLMGEGGGLSKYKKNIRARGKNMKKIHAFQLILKNIRAMA